MEIITLNSKTLILNGNYYLKFRNNNKKNNLLLNFKKNLDIKQ